MVKQNNWCPLQHESYMNMVSSVEPIRANISIWGPQLTMGKLKVAENEAVGKGTVTIEFLII